MKKKEAAPDLIVRLDELQAVYQQAVSSGNIKAAISALAEAREVMEPVERYKQAAKAP